ncbi:MAG: pilus assembly protein PilO [Chromatiales bacterium 21-64-14]|nr:MAG: pilus assembly protein PilO [Chromatiales bacterium 21-64-14]HQU16832.1 type 4a pilus biogenesis protein PilO [Gammaproteobacteria bacterium]
MNLSDFKELDLDFHNAGSWPWPVKGVFIGLLSVVVLFAGYWFDLSHQWEGLQQARQQEVSLKQVFESKQRKAANLEAYEKQLVEMRKSFGAMLRQLPSKTEVADLLVDISQTGLASGLEFRLFKPEPEIRKDFYAELPIRIEVTGQYHEFGKFVSGVAALSRIVTLHNISIKPENKSGKLIMDLTAKTYRYLEEGEGGK